MISWRLKEIIKALFQYGCSNDKYAFKGVSCSEDNVGQYYKYSYITADAHYYYPDLSVIVNQWMRVGTVPNIMFAKVVTAPNYDERSPMSLMYDNGELFIVTGCSIGKDGGYGSYPETFNFRAGNTKIGGKTERGIRTALKNFTVRKIR